MYIALPVSPRELYWQRQLHLNIASLSCLKLLLWDSGFLMNNTLHLLTPERCRLVSSECLTPFPYTLPLGWSLDLEQNNYWLPLLLLFGGEVVSLPIASLRCFQIFTNLVDYSTDSLTVMDSYASPTVNPLIVEVNACTLNNFHLIGGEYIFG